MRLNQIGSVHVVLGKNGRLTARLCTIKYEPLPWAAPMHFRSRERLLGYLGGLGNMLGGRPDLFVPVESNGGTVTYVRRDQADGFYHGLVQSRLGPEYVHLREWWINE